MCSGFDEANIVVMDGVGEVECTTLWTGHGDTIKKERSMAVPDSLGFFYGAMTEHLGYHINSGEGKVRGLAPYGKFDPELYDKMAEICLMTEDSYYINPDFADLNGYCIKQHKLQEMFGKAVKSGNTDELEKPLYRNIAFALQKRLEDVALHLIKSNRIEGKLAIGGGVALNVKMNQVLREDEAIDELFVMPAAGDNGCCMGAAIHVAAQMGYKTKNRMDHVYLGPEYSNEQIQGMLDNNKVDYECHKDVTGVTAELLTENKIVGWFQGKMEFGPRALGNRSILMSPLKAENKDIINARVKFREAYRPFCPSMTYESKDEFLVDAEEAPFMIVAFDVKEGMGSKIPAVTHVDGTARPQTVRKQTNPVYHKLIQSFGKETGVPVVLNTSFNVRGEPIVCTPKDAVSCFFNTGMDYLVMGNFLVKKTKD
ncbi:MAG: carbamoyltransferase [Candidatus Diapherotrites archaeon]|nr:carbamoyltransferase [Candidatus Diapherotrites archaeon]